jgi:hypothetical protein
MVKIEELIHNFFDPARLFGHTKNDSSTQILSIRLWRRQKKRIAYKGNPTFRAHP